jgi:hypothetical protein
MPTTVSSPRASRRNLSSREGAERVVLLTALTWGALIWGLVVRDVISELPPRPPTPAEVAAGRPRAEAKWRVVRAMLVWRLDQRNPLELGGVWSTRTGVVCGLVNGWGSFGGLTGMTRFIAMSDTPTFVEDASTDDDARRFETLWVDCRSDPWIVLHSGSAQSGFCATRLGQKRCVEAGPIANPIRLTLSASRAR